MCNKRVLVPGKPLRPSLMLVDKAIVEHFSGVPCKYPVRYFSVGKTATYLE